MQDSFDKVILLIKAIFYLKGMCAKLIAVEKGFMFKINIKTLFIENKK